MRKRTVILLTLLATPSIAMANPSPIAGPYGPFYGLLAEANSPTLGQRQLFLPIDDNYTYPWFSLPLDDE